MAPHEWDGNSYDLISKPIEINGRDVLARLNLRGDETVLDAGCGSGRVTEVLADQLPDGHVIGVDGSAGMVAAAHERLGDRAELHVSDICEVDLGGRRVDAVFSNAVFHWIADHDALFARLHGVMKPGARLAAQCGAYGNCHELDAAIAAVTAHEPFSEYLDGWSPWNYATAGETITRLQGAGFHDVVVEVVQRPAPYDDLRAWLDTNALSAHQLRLPEALRQDFVDAVLAELDGDVSYVRLNIDATA